ncbi:MAG: GyrI-like domain-containing protein, partial [Armatimonadota bacterium]
MDNSPTFETLPAFDLFGLAWHGTDSLEIPPLWHRFPEVFGPYFAEVPDGISYGACGPMDASGAFDYLMALQCPEGFRPGPECAVWHIDAGRWAVFPTTIATIRETFHKIHADTTLARREGPMLERYPADFGPDSGKTLHIL